MARDITGRLFLRGMLVARTPLHVGGSGDEVDTDFPLARDGAGRLSVPGTSLAGALRQWCEQGLGRERVEAIWGAHNSDRAAASHVVVEDAAIEDTGTMMVEVRDGVGMDREWGAAAELIKYDRAVLPRGTRLPLRLTVELGRDHGRDETIAMLAALREALAAGEVRLGAAKTRGLGRIALLDAAIGEQVFHTRLGILTALRMGSSGAPLPDAEIASALRAHPPRPTPRLEVAVDWHPLGSMMVQAGFDGIAVDILPLVSGVEGGPALVLPGSSVKGVLRAQAERIVRTLLDRDVSRERDPKQRFLHDLDLPLIHQLFGRRGSSENARRRGTPVGPPATDPLPGLGALSIDDCYATRHLRAEEWRKIQAAERDQDLRTALKGTTSEKWQAAYHVAVDRWTGGAAEGLLYTVLEPHGAAWEPLHLRVDLARLAPPDRLPAVALLLLVLRDLTAGRLPLGFGTYRGMGAIAVTKITLATRGTGVPLEGLPPIVPGPDWLASLPEKARQELDQAWKKWLAATSQTGGAA